MGPFFWNEADVERVLGVSAEVSQTDYPYDTPRQRHTFLVKRDHYKLIFAVTPAIGNVWICLKSSKSRHQGEHESFVNFTLSDCQGINYIILGKSDTLEMATRFTDPIEIAFNPSMSTGVQVSIDPEFSINYRDYASRYPDSN